MAQLQNIEAKILDSHFIDGQRSQFADAKPSQSAKKPHKFQWELNRQLQTSLDINDILNIFFDGIQKEFHCAQLIYENKAANFNTTLGERSARHSCNYQIEIANEPLGKLCFTRLQRFSESDLHYLEELLCLLVYPLRNALLYRDALQKAMHDPLTGALNRAALDTMLDKEIDLAHRHENSLSVLMIDVDHFKNINDNYGHSVGDQVLRMLVDKLKNQIRTSDVLFRYGGEEFTIILSNTSSAGANLLAQRVRCGIEEMIYQHQETALKFTISIGMATLVENEVAKELLDRADEALYSAKKLGRNCVIQS
ncbi:MAG: GGDEF domain-containing protein [Sulfuriflexus sp.]|nr:GGDEF domain-containing protein [Sulfuriflexus sp.]